MIISHPLKAILAETSLPFPEALQEKWYLKLNDPKTQRALWLEWDLLTSKNGFKRSAEIRAIFFERGQNREVKKTALKQTLDISAFSRGQTDSIKMGECVLENGKTHGKIHSKAQTIVWNLSFRPLQEGTFNLIPELLSKLGLTKRLAITPYEDLLFSGSIQVNQETFTFSSARGMLGRSLSPKNWHSWVWGHCNTFTNDQNQPSDFVFEGMTSRSQVGPLQLPKLSTFYFRYQGKDYAFNRMRQIFYTKSKNTLNEWKFQADHDDLSFRGHLKAELKDFAGLTFEDTNGSLLYSANSKLSELKILVYRRGKLEASFNSKGSSAFEIVSRQKNPYVPLVI
jgi:hypothetical protein